ncbi:MAG: homoserine kinase [Bacteroidia bacterium]|nr:homoserine kinase [Bacteroidia bacterium]
MPNEIRITSPATVANVACGFDVLGFCLDKVGDEMVIRKTAKKGISITKIEGYNLPLNVNENVAGISALATYNVLKPDCGFEIEIYKKVKPGSGIGSSSSSAAGSVFGINALLDKPLSKSDLVKFAMQGEYYASKSEHADNIAPCIYGGFTLVKSVDPLKILELPTPDDLFAVIIHPQIEIKTSEARALLPLNVPLYSAIKQSANLGSLVHALHTSNYQLISESLNDVLIEPLRKKLIPNYDEVKEASLKNGALGCSISGSGPSIFALCKGNDSATSVKKVVSQIYSRTAIKFDIFISKINTEGIKIVE